MIPTMLLPWQHSWLQVSLCEKPNIPICNLLGVSGPEGLAPNTNGSHIVLTLPIRLVGVDDPCSR